MKKFIIALALTLSACTNNGIPNNPICNTKSQELIIGNGVLNASIACSNEEKSTGLMNVKSMPANNGMVFVFDKLDYHQFWMKNTLIPLSIAFVDQNWIITDIKDMQANDLTPVYPQRPSLYAVETNLGWFTQHNVKIGDQIKLKP